MGRAMPVSAIKAKTKNAQRDQTKGSEKKRIENNPPQPITMRVTADGRTLRNVIIRESIAGIIPAEGFGHWRAKYPQDVKLIYTDLRDDCYCNGFQMIESTMASMTSRAATAAHMALISVVAVTVIHCVGRFSYTSRNSVELSAR